MTIIIKYTLKSIFEHKFRTFLILLSIVLSVALTISSFALRDVTRNAIVEVVKKYMGTANVMVTGDSKYNTDLVRQRDLGEVAKLFDYQIGSMQSMAVYKEPDSDQTSNLIIRGYKETDLSTLGVVSLIDKIDGPFQGKQIYIADSVAEKYGWKLGQYIELYFDGVKQKLQIVGIGTNAKALEYSENSINAIVPAGFLQKIYNTQDRYFYLLLKTKEGVDVEAAMAELQTVYSRYKVDEPIPWSQIEGMLNNIIVPFIFMLLLVLATAVFIIFTAFKVITTEKLPVLGTFRSIGATKKTVDFILLAESFTYGLIGGLIGILLGNLILGVIASFIAQQMGMMTVENLANVNISYYMAAVLFGILLSIVSSIVPILKVSNLSVRDIVLGFTESFKNRSVQKTIIGVIMLMLALIIPNVEVLSSNILFNLVATILLCAGIIVVVPAITILFIKPLAIIAGLLFGNIGRLSVKNINGNKSVTDNIALLTIGIAGILLINVLSATITAELSNAMRDAKYDVWMRMPYIDKNVINKVKSTTEVKGVFPNYSRNGIKINGTNLRINRLVTADSMAYFDYFDLPFASDRKFAKNNIGITRSIILTTTLKRQLGVELGDTITLELREDKGFDYMVVGFVDTIVANGSFAIINEFYYAKDAAVSSYNELMIKSYNPDQTAEDLRETFSKRQEQFNIMTKDEIIEMNGESNAVIINVFKGFSVVAMLIGTFGILNNFIVSLLARQRSLAVMKSVGMSRKQTFAMLVLEATMSGVIGGACGIVGAMLLVFEVNQFFKLLNVPFKMAYQPSIFISGLFAGILISLLSSLLPARKVARMNIVSAIKYE